MSICNIINQPMQNIIIDIQKATYRKKENQISIKNQIKHIRIIPIVTKVNAWIKADTGIGPSIASGNQTCNPNWVDLLKQHTNKLKTNQNKTKESLTKNKTKYTDNPLKSNNSKIKAKQKTNHLIYLLIALNHTL